MPAMGTPHWIAMQIIAKPLEKAFGDQYFVSNQCPVNLGPVSDPEPDFAVISGDPLAFTALPKMAALIVEVSASTLVYDRTTKASLYARAGIEDYWIVNLGDRQIEVHRHPNSESVHALRVWLRRNRCLQKRRVHSALNRPHGFDCRYRSFAINRNEGNYGYR